jgi:carbon storage regulator
MLILTRKDGETIKIGNDIRVTVVSINGTQVRIGIEAPKSVTILRKELAEAD